MSEFEDRENEELGDLPEPTDIAREQRALDLPGEIGHRGIAATATEGLFRISL